MKSFFFLSFSILLFSSCNTVAKSSAQEHNVTVSTDLNGEFFVETLNGTHIASNKLTINFNTETHNIYGFSGCNRFSGNYTLNGNSIKIGPLASTKMLCIDDAVNKTETKFLEALATVDSIVFKETKLLLLNKDKTVLTATKHMQEISNATSFNYSAISRGTFLKIAINDSIVTVTRNRKDKPTSKPLSEESFKKLKTLVSTINLDSMPLFKDPTQARFYDGAAIGTFKIVQNGNTYESTNFDHGTPPKEIETIVKEILSLSENVE